MSVTPDFVGQRYRDSDTGNIWIANSTAPGDWEIDLQNATTEWQPTDKLLTHSLGFFTYSDLPDITDVQFLATTTIEGYDLEYWASLISLQYPNLTSIDPLGIGDGSFYAASLDGLISISMPSLITTNSSLNIYSCPVLPTISLPSLASVGGSLNFYDNAMLETISAPLLQTISDYFRCYGNPLLTTIEVTLLETLGSVGAGLSCYDCTSLITVNFPSLQSTGNFDLSDNAALTTVSLPSLTTFTGSQVDVRNCALSETTVNGLLATFVAIAAFGAGKSLRLDGGTNAAPSGQGILDKATLIARGATVTTN